MFSNFKGFRCKIIVIFFLLSISSGCAGLNSNKDENADISGLPPGIDFYVSPKKEQYRPYEKVTLYLRVKDNGTLQKNCGIPSNKESRIHFTGLTKVNGSYTYTVDWKNIHRNFHGHEGKTKRIAWYLNDNWNSIIPQEPGKYSIQFNISTPVGYWLIEPITISIYLPLEDTVPFNELLENDLQLFFEYEYVCRMYNTNWSTYDSCPKIRLPYEEMQDFVKKYPHFYLTKSLKKKLKRTKRIIVNKHTQYDVDDIRQIDNLLNILENPA